MGFDADTMPPCTSFDLLGQPDCARCAMSPACASPSRTATRQSTHTEVSVSDEPRQSISLVEVVAVLTALVAGGLGGAGVAAARAAFGRPVTLALVLAYAAIGAGGAVGSLVVDLFALLVQVAPVRIIDGAPILARMMFAGVVTVLAVLLVQTQGSRLLERAGLRVRIEREGGDGANVRFRRVE